MGDETQWDLFRTFEAIVRQGSLTAAAKSLGVSQSTVSRHLARLEQDAGSPLLLRGTPMRLTDRGTAVLAAVEPMIEAALGARAALEQTPELRGEVTITTIGEVVRWVLTRRFAGFYRSHPQLRLRVLANPRQDSLSAGVADLALRMARPAKGELVGRKLSVETFGFYAAATLPLGADVPWVGLAGGVAQLAEQLHADRAFAPRPPRLLVEDLESLGLVIQDGIGVGVLPRRFASRLAGVVEVQPDRIGALDLGPIPDREIWLVVHRSKQRVPKIRAVMAWLEAVFAERGR